MAAGVRSSSSTWSSLRSISSRRRRISERLLSEVMTSQHWSKRPRLEGGWGACQPGPLAERIGNVELNPLRSALLCRPYVGPNASLVAQDPVRDLFVSAKDFFVEANGPHGAIATSFHSDRARPGRSEQSVLSFVASRSSFLIGELLLGKLSETVVVQGNAPHDRPGFLVGHLIGNRASFLCTKAPMLRIPETNFLHGIRSISGRDVRAIFRRRHQHGFYRVPSSRVHFLDECCSSARHGR